MGIAEVIGITIGVLSILAILYKMLYFAISKTYSEELAKTFVSKDIYNITINGLNSTLCELKQDIKEIKSLIMSNRND